MRRPGLLLSLLALAACATPEPPPAVRDGTDTALLRMAAMAQARGDTPLSIALYRRAVETSPRDLQALLGYGDALSAAGEYEPAAGAYRAVLEQDPDHAGALYSLACIDLVYGDLASARSRLEQARARLPGDPRVGTALGVAYDLEGRHREAQAAYRAALAAAPGDLDLKSNLALSLALSNQPDAALATGREAANAPMAMAAHRRNYVLVTALTRGSQAADLLGRRLVGPEETARILSQAALVRTTAAGPARARGLTAVLAPPMPPTS